MIDSDRSFIIFTALAASRYGPDYGLPMMAHKNNEAQKRYWLGAERLVQRLVEKCEVTVAEAETDGSRVICGYVIGEDSAIVHYTLTRRRFMRMGVAKDLLEPWLSHGQQVLYSFRPTIRAPMPENWMYDPFCAWKWFK